MVTLATPRLILRPWRAEDAEPFAAMGQDPAVMEHFPSLLDRAQSDAMMGRITSHFAREGFGLWAVEVPGVAPFIGFCGLSRPSWWLEVIEVGWRLARPYWGHGYATEAARASLAHGFDVVGLEEILAFVVPRNTRSQAVMTRIGMTRDPAGDFVHPLIPAEHALAPHLLYRASRPPSPGPAAT